MRPLGGRGAADDGSRARHNGAMASTIADLEVETPAGNPVRLGQFLGGVILLLLPRYYG